MANLIANVEQMAEEIIKAKIKNFTDSLPNPEETIEQMVDAAKAQIKSKLDQLNSLYDSVQTAITNLSGVPADIAQAIASAATILPPGGGVPVVVSQTMANIKSWKSQLGTATAALSQLNDTVGLLGMGVPALEPIVQTLSTVQSAIDTVGALIDAIPLG